MLVMNRLTTAQRVQILSMLCEGSSMRAVSRITDVSINTVAKLLVDAGTACARFHEAARPRARGTYRPRISA
jgi:transposase-like protein